MKAPVRPWLFIRSLISMNTLMSAAITLSSLTTLASQAEGTTLNIAMVLWRGITDAEKGFQEELAKLGYQAQYTLYDAQQDRNALATNMREQYQRKMDTFQYVYSFGTTTSVIAKQVTKGRVPHIFNIVTDPVGAKLVPSLTNGGNQIAGVTNGVDLELQIKTALDIKQFSTLGLFFNPREKNSMDIRNNLFKLAKNRGFTVLEYRSPPVDGELEQHFNAWDQGTLPDAIYLPSDSYIVSQANTILTKAMEKGLFTIGAQKEYVVAGAVMALAPDYYKLGQKAADIIDKNQKGQALDSIPIAFDEAPKLLISERGQKAANLDIKEEILSKAERLP